MSNNSSECGDNIASNHVDGSGERSEAVDEIKKSQSNMDVCRYVSAINCTESSSVDDDASHKYQCTFCSEIVDRLPLSIRQHLMSNCSNVPTAVKNTILSECLNNMEGDTNGDSSENDGASSVNPDGLPPRNAEENYCIVLQRSSTPTSKSSNSKYRCKFCSFEFVGGPQKIRVHLTGVVEGGTRIKLCPYVPPEVVETVKAKQMKLRPEISRPHEFASQIIDGNIVDNNHRESLLGKRSSEGQLYGPPKAPPQFSHASIGDLSLLSQSTDLPHYSNIHPYSSSLPPPYTDITPPILCASQPLFAPSINSNMLAMWQHAQFMYNIHIANAYMCHSNIVALQSIAGALNRAQSVSCPTASEASSHSVDPRSPPTFDRNGDSREKT